MAARMPMIVSKRRQDKAGNPVIGIVNVRRKQPHSSIAISPAEWKRSPRSCFGCFAVIFLLVPVARAQQADQLQQQLLELKQEYTATTQALELRMAALELQIEQQKVANQKTKEATVSAADLAAERVAQQAVLGRSDQVGAKFQGELPSEPTYDLLKEADRRSPS